jgi:SAM-dependent methyltransferase
MFSPRGVWRAPSGQLRKGLQRIPFARPVVKRFRRLIRPALLGTLRRTAPLSTVWGADRGTPLDRFYIDQFLDEHRQDIRGRILEVGDSRYTDRFASDVTSSDVLDLDRANRHATIVADLASADAINSDQFDCFLLVQTLQYIYNPASALWHAYRILRPGGVLLLTVPSVSRIDPVLRDYWRFTAPSCTALLAEVFRPNDVSISSYGNVLTAIASLTGMAHEELSSQELNESDEFFPLLVAARAVKKI